jgi:CBS domain-containing protein
MADRSRRATLEAMNIATSTPTPLDTIAVREAMHPGVLTCPPDAPLRTVAQIMARYRIHCVVVWGDLDELGLDGNVWGVVSDLDLVGAADDLDGRTAASAAATEIVTVAPAASLAEAARLLTEHAVTHLVVVDPRSDRPVGVLSTLDVARALVSGPVELESLAAAGMALLL